MSNFFSEAENAAQGFEGQGQQGGNGQSMQQDNSSSGGGGGGFGGLAQDAERMEGQGQGQDQSAGGSSGGGSGGFMNNMESAGKDQMLNQGSLLSHDMQLVEGISANGICLTEVNSFMSKEGVPQAADNTVDKFVDQEANKFM